VRAAAAFCVSGGRRAAPASYAVEGAAAEVGRRAAPASCAVEGAAAKVGRRAALASCALLLEECPGRALQPEKSGREEKGRRRRLVTGRNERG